MPGWEIQVEEVSAGVYQLRATHPDGRTVGFRGSDPDAMTANVAGVVATDRDFDSQTRETFNALAAKVAAAREPYWPAVDLRECLDQAIVRSVEASRLWHIWAELEDRYELNPDKRSEAEDLMRRAAKEWLAVHGDRAARESYLDRWQYDICGYERK
jgi:hypothetical protein